MKPYTPLGFLHLSAHLRRHGLEPEIYFRVSGRHSSAFYRHTDGLLRSEMARDPDPVRIHATREADRQTRAEVEA